MVTELDSKNFNSFLFLDCIVYDDACHLLKYSKNPVRKDDTNTSKRIATLEMKIDRFHYRNHVDPWCRRVCNPKTSDHLAGVSNYLYSISIIDFTTEPFSEAKYFVTYSKLPYFHGKAQDYSVCLDYFRLSS